MPNAAMPPATFNPQRATGAGPGPAIPLGSRAAELVRRVTDQRARPRMPLEPGSGAFDPSAGEAKSTNDATISEAEAKSLGAAPLRDVIERDPEIGDQSHLFGVRRTSRGWLFLQPIGEARAISIAGEFNGWSPDSHPMRRNEDAGVFERIIELPPGPHQYRLVIDGRWVADPHNPDQLLNTYGEPISLIDVAPSP
jgi:hypothetical protein